MTMNDRPLIDLAEFEAFADGLDHPECVAWGPDGFVYAGGEAGQIYRVSLESGEVTLVGSTGGFNLGVVVDGSCNVYSCDSANRGLFRTAPDGTTEVFSSGTAERPMICPNYAVFDAEGRLYVSDSGDWQQANGCIWVVESGGEARVLTDDVREHSNGLALSRDGRFLYCAESLRAGVVRIPLSNGYQSGPVEVVLPLPETVLADGLAFDIEGSLIIACYTPDVIYKLTLDGRLSVLGQDLQRVTLAAPTNVAFCGPGLSTLVIGSLGRWHLTKVPMSVAGQPLHYPLL